ncbi:hypothetical protein H5410_052739 [Solanum commersonii]|uniref:Uncharacterized protein n=1 Tax=Solanum commersonii TaxID=4109 RepID=A0A9J5X503_SOLCO|nr:hypothetical protein H5410_052739 [Solanum commersonii]
MKEIEISKQNLASWTMEPTFYRKFGAINENSRSFFWKIGQKLCRQGGFDLTDLFPSQKWLHNINNRAKGKKCNGRFGNEDLVDDLLKVMGSGEFRYPITNQNIKAFILVSLTHL